MARLFGRGETSTEEVFKVQHTEEEWKQILNPQQFQVLATGANGATTVSQYSNTVTVT